MEYERPIILAIGGLDPCGGAGLLADVKTIEQHHCLGFGVATSLTCQTEDRFLNIKWLAGEEIICQLQPLLQQYTVAAVKLGLIENIRTLSQILDLLTEHGIQNIIWDPVLSATAGFEFDNLGVITDSSQLLSRVYLITPNIQEAKILANSEDAIDAAKRLSVYTNVLLKGGHLEREQGVDTLFIHSQAIRLMPNVKQIHAKHGTGCILSSSIASLLAKNESLESACVKAKLYIEKILASTPNLLAYHHV